MTWELGVGAGVAGPLAAAPDPTIAALAATVASAAATRGGGGPGGQGPGAGGWGRVGGQATEARAMMVGDSGLEAANATACDVSASGPWKSNGSGGWDAAGMTDEGTSGPGGTMRDLAGEWARPGT